MEQDEWLCEAVDRWEASRQRGIEVTAEELCKDRPHLVEVVRHRIDLLRQFEDFAESGLSTVERDASSPQAPMTGGVPPDYEFVRELGRGGMGVVVLARDKRLNRTVALKRIETRDSQIGRFRTEAEAVARLQHPNVVQVFEVGEFQGQPFLAMEYVDGGTLAEQCRGHGVAARQAVEWVRTIALAMEAVHQNGIIHRDLKPSNILLTKSGVPKVGDFGLAKLRDGALTGVSHRTNSTAILGTPNYMSPEQAAGKVQAIGVAADVYGLGAILYSLLCGRPPFEGEHLFEIITQVQESEPVRPRSLNPSIPTDVETICLKCLNKEASRRYATAAEAAADLDRFLEGRSIAARPEGWSRRTVRWSRRNPRLAAALALSIVLLVGATILGVLYGLSESNRRQEAEQRARQEALERRSSQIRLAESARDRAIELWTQTKDDVAALWLVRALEDCPADADQLRLELRTQLANTLQHLPRQTHAFNDIASLQLTHTLALDGQKILRRTQAGVQLFHLLEQKAIGPVVPIDLAQQALFWPRKGSRAAFVHGKKAAVIDLANGQTVASWTLPTESLGFDLDLRGTFPGLFADTALNRILIAHSNGATTLWSAKTGKPMDIDLPRDLATAAFSENGHWLAIATRSDHVEVIGLTERNQRFALKGIVGLPHVMRFDPTGERLVVASGEPFATGEATVWTVPGGKRIARLPHLRPVRDARFTADGTAIVTGSDDTEARIWDAKTGAIRQRTMVHGDSVRCVAFSPDGRAVAVGTSDGRVHVWDRATGSLMVPVLTIPGELREMEWTSNRTIVAASFAGSIRRWDLEHPTILRHESRIQNFWIEETGIGTLSRTHGAMRWEWDSDGIPKATFRSNWRAGTSIVTDSGRLFACARNDRIELYDSNGMHWRDIASGLPPVQPVAIVDRGSAVLIRRMTAEGASQLELWETAKGGQRGLAMDIPKGSFLVISPDSRTLAVNTVNQGTIRWDLTSGRSLGISCITNPTYMDNAVAWTGDSREFFVSSQELTESTVDQPPACSISRWSASTGERIGNDVSLPFPGKVLAISPDRQWIAVAGSRKAILIELASGQAMPTQLEAPANIHSLGFSPDSQILVISVLSNATNQSVQLWNVATLRPMGPPIRHSGGVPEVRFEPSGRFLWTRDTQDGVYRWAIPEPVVDDPPALRNRVQEWTGRSFDVVTRP